MDELIGKTLGQYEIIEKIGQGGMATVFKAYQATLDRYVAVKVLSPLLAEQEPGFTERFQREAHAIARLNHPNILQVYDSGLQDRYHYLVMRYVENSVTLDTLMRQGAPIERLIDYIVQVADALNYAHERGIIHRDIKPGNILIDGKWALLSDFGLVKATGSDSQLTGTGVGMGTPAYISPEQARGIRVDHRTDIYALGVILHKVLTGVIPHDGPTPLAIIVKRTTEPIPPLSQIKPDVPLSLETVTMRALAKEPNQRYSTATHFAESLQKAYQDPDFREEDTWSPDAEATVASGLDELDDEAPTLVDTEKEEKEERSPSMGLIFGAAALVVVIALIIFLASMRAGKRNHAGAGLTPTGGEAAAVVGAESPTATPTPPPPTATATPVPPGTPQAIVKEKIEVWSGPGPGYDLLGYLPAGAQAEISSQDENGAWWQIKTSLSPLGLGWIQAEPDLVEAVDAGSVPIALAPPTATPTATITPSPSPLPPSPTPTPPEPSPQSSPPPTAPTPPPTPPSTNTPATPDVVAAASPTATLPAGQFRLLKPASVDEPTFGPTEFEWQWTDSLPEDQGFEVRVWQEGEPPMGVHNAVLDNQNGTIEQIDENSYRLVTDITEAPSVQSQRGEYNWTVVLVQISPEYKDLGIQAPPGKLRFEPPFDDGGGGGGGGGLTGGD